MTDTLQPNVLTVGDDGSIGALFPGGVQIPEISGPQTLAPETQALTFERQSDGAVVAQLFASDNGGGNHSVSLHTNLAGIAGTAARSEIDLVAESPDAHNRASLTVFAENTGGLNGHGIVAQCEAVNPIVIRNDGASSFLQLLSAQQLQLAFGTGTVTWNGSSGFANGSVAHGLGRVPKWAGLTPLNQFGGGWLVMVNSWDATNISVQANTWNTFPARTDTFYWAAIG